MLENHLSSEQGRMLNEIQAAATDANISLFFTGGALRDMLGGQPIRALDFTVEGNPLKIAKTVAAKVGATIASTNELRKQVQLEYAGRGPASAWRIRNATASRARSRRFRPPPSMKTFARAISPSTLSLFRFRGRPAGCHRPDQRHRRSGAPRAADGIELRAVRRPGQNSAADPAARAPGIYH